MPDPVFGLQLPSTAVRRVQARPRAMRRLLPVRLREHVVGGLSARSPICGHDANGVMPGQLAHLSGSGAAGRPPAQQLGQPCQACRTDLEDAFLRAGRGHQRQLKLAVRGGNRSQDGIAAAPTRPRPLTRHRFRRLRRRCRV